MGFIGVSGSESITFHSEDVDLYASYDFKGNLIESSPLIVIVKVSKKIVHKCIIKITEKMPVGVESKLA